MSTINVGKIRPTYQGAYDAEKDYAFLDWVTYEGSSYSCINLSGSPAGTEVTNETYWACMASKAWVEFATEEEIAAGTTGDKVISPAALQPIIDQINELIDTLEEKTSSGQVADADLLDGQHGEYYRCASGCSWTCSSECSGGCGNTCTGSCHSTCTTTTASSSSGCSGCSAVCEATCAQSCAGACFTSCTRSCANDCGGACSGQPN